MISGYNNKKIDGHSSASSSTAHMKKPTSAPNQNENKTIDSEKDFFTKFDSHTIDNNNTWKEKDRLTDKSKYKLTAQNVQTILDDIKNDKEQYMKQVQDALAKIEKQHQETKPKRPKSLSKSTNQTNAIQPEIHSQIAKNDILSSLPVPGQRADISLVIPPDPEIGYDLQSPAPPEPSIHLSRWISFYWKIFQLFIIIVNIISTCVSLWANLSGHKTCYTILYYWLYTGIAVSGIIIISACFFIWKLPGLRISEFDALVRVEKLTDFFLITRAGSVLYYLWLVVGVVALAQGPEKGCSVERNVDLIYQVSYYLAMIPSCFVLVLGIIFGIAPAYCLLLNLHSDDVTVNDNGQFTIVQRGLSRSVIDEILVDSFKPTHGNNCCSVCMNDFEDAELVKILPCEHQFHPQCINMWLSKNKNCPDCRHPVEDPAPPHVLERRKENTDNNN